MRVIDSHTEGEPTRVVIEGGPDLGAGPLAERRALFASTFDHLRRFAILEPRGHEAIVGALLCAPVDPSCAAGVIFFNNAGYLGMCGHGTIGLAVTLAQMGRIAAGTHRIETPVGIVSVELVDAHTAAVTNVESRRARKAVRVDAGEAGTVTGDIAWGGNWFFLTEDAPCALVPENIRALTRHAEAIRAGLVRAGLTGDDGGEIDHIELFGPPGAADAHSRNFVLCPGSAYDRSPCGTGTSAKLACLAADGKLAPGQPWVQESIIGSRFTARYTPGQTGGVIARIEGRAFVIGEAVLRREVGDPFGEGI